MWVAPPFWIKIIIQQENSDKVQPKQNELLK